MVFWLLLVGVNGVRGISGFALRSVMVPFIAVGALFLVVVVVEGAGVLVMIKCAAFLA